MLPLIHQKHSNMRPILIVIVSGCFGFFACKSSDKEELTIQMDTYTYDRLEYPDRDVLVPDSLQNEFIDTFFTPWKMNPEDLPTTLESFPGKDLSYLEKYLNEDEWYGENKQQHKKWQKEEIVTNANPKDFPNFLKRGIVTSHTNLRRVPTHKPGFDRYSKAGEGYPFDYFQETIAWANTPVFIAHITRDRQWCYVISSFYKGWVSMHDLAIADQDFIKQWLTGNYCLPISDELNLQNEISNYAVNAKMGMLLPYEESPNNTDKITVYYVSANENQNAKVLKAEVAKSEVALNDLKINEHSLKKLVANLIGRPYGWGGYLENRDCSSMIRDLFSTYKIGLPRDSKDQIRVGYTYDLSGSADEKIRLIKEKGVPFFTILRKKGHNMLYVGEAPNGEPLILHAIWGLKTSYADAVLAEMLKKYPIEGIHQEANGKLKGRHIIGEAVITSVNLGSGDSQMTTPLIDEIYAMTNILEH